MKSRTEAWRINPTRGFAVIRRIPHWMLCMAALLASSPRGDAAMMAADARFQPALPARGAFEFFEEGVLEARIELISKTPGPQDNGLGVQLLTAASATIVPITSDSLYSIEGNRYVGYSITLPNDVDAIAYRDLVEVFVHIAEVRADFTLVVEGASLEPQSQGVPGAPLFLAGGAEAVIPEPCSVLALAVLLALAFSGFSLRRDRFAERAEAPAHCFR
ncbi:MAG: hypothetical protein AAGJ46_13315 [Planctomycetota bacterium]